MKKLVLWVLLCLCCILLCACGDGAESKTEHTHSFTDTVVLPSCTEGYTIHACMLCGYSYTDTYTPANGHSFLRTVNDCACDVRLEEQYACSVCGYSYVVTSEQFGAQHSFDVKEKVSATRETEGYTVYVCSLCGEMKEGDFVPPTEFSVGLSYAKRGAGYYVTGMGSCTDTELIIPSVNEHGETVTGIASYAFAGNGELFTVKVGQGISVIEEYAFSGCIGLRSMSIGKDTVVQSGAFVACVAMEEMTLPLSTSLKALFAHGTATEVPESLKTVHLVGELEIDRASLAGCTHIKRVTVAPEITSIPPEAFRGCTSLEEIVLHDAITSIGSQAFADTAIREFTLPRAMNLVTNELLALCTELVRVDLHDGVTGIGWCAFAGCASLEEIKLPPQMTVIGEWAFADCTSLKRIELPQSLKTIAKGAFVRCVSMEQFTLPSGVSELGDSVFEECTSLRQISLHSNLKRIGAKAFMKTALTEFVLPEGVQSVGEYAFASCTKLVRLELNGSLLTVAANLANGCAALRHVQISQRVTSIGDAAFMGCTSLTELQLPSGLMLLGKSAFEECRSLVSIEIPSGVVKLDNKVFFACASLGRVQLSQRLTVIGASAFQNCASLGEIALPTSLQSIGENAFSGTGLVSLNVPETVQGIGKYAFSACRKLASATLGGERTAFGTHVFAYCTNLKTAVLRDGTAAVSNAMFVQCTSLQEITLSQTLQSIGTDAFAGCSSLEEITIPRSVTTVKSAFSQCTSLKTVYFNAENAESASIANGEQIVFGEAVESIPALLCYGNTKLKSVTFMGNVRSIGKSAFASCTALEHIDFPASLTEIGSMAFYKTALKEVSITAQTLTVGEKAFAASGQLLHVRFEADTLVLGSGAFQYCAALSSVDFGNGSATLGGGVFYECGALTAVTGDEQLRLFDASDLPTQLYTVRDGILFYGATLVGYDEATVPTDVVIPDGIRYIIDGAFQGCDLIRRVTFPDTVREIGAYAFEGCTRLQSVTLPEGVTHVGEYAFARCTVLTEVSFPNTLTEILSGVLWECGSLRTVTLGASLARIADDFYCSTDGGTGGLNNPLTVIYRSTVAQWSQILLGSANPIHQCTVICTDGKLVGILLTETVASGVLTVDAEWTMTLTGNGCFQYDFNNAYSDYYNRVKKLVIGEGITELKSNRLSYFTSLEEIVFPTTLTTFPAGQFVNSPWYQNATDYENGLLIAQHRLLDVLQDTEGKLVLPDGLISIGGRAFDNCTLLEELIIPEGVKEIGDQAFYYCLSLRSVTLPESLERMGEYVFSGCHALTELTVPKGVKEIRGLVSSCDSLRYLWILGSPNIGNYAYATYCPSLEYVVLGVGTVELPATCIYHCTALKGIVIPVTLIAPEAGAIARCPSGVKLFFEGPSNADLVTSVLNHGTGTDAEPLNAVAYLYSQETPEDVGLYWYWGEDGLPEIWNT